MAILVDEHTRLAVQGLTGRQGTFHAMRNRDYGTKVVAGVTPGKGGSDVQGVPVFDTMEEAVAVEGANTSMVFVPPAFAADAILESAAAGVELVVCITEGIPAHDEARVYSYLQATSEVVLIGPNCPGVLSPGKANVGIMPHEITMPGSVGVVSRSGTLTYQAVHELTVKDIGQSTCIGIGGDPVPGTSFVDILTRFEADSETAAMVMIGEIGGAAEEEAEPVDRVGEVEVAYIAGFTAPKGKKMGHAGAIITGSLGTAAAKRAALEAAGVQVATYPSEIGELITDALQ
ncbi:MAG: succinate--CoA ligase subunit alpha [Acidimicrobiia bacterium]